MGIRWRPCVPDPTALSWEDRHLSPRAASMTVSGSLRTSLPVLLKASWKFFFFLNFTATYVLTLALFLLYTLFWKIPVTVKISATIRANDSQIRVSGPGPPELHVCMLIDISTHSILNILNTSLKTKFFTMTPFSNSCVSNFGTETIPFGIPGQISVSFLPRMFDSISYSLINKHIAFFSKKNIQAICLHLGSIQ